MNERFSGEIGARLCVECDSLLVAGEGDGVTMRLHHCGGCSESCDCAPDLPHPDRPREPFQPYESPYWMRSGRHG